MIAYLMEQKRNRLSSSVIFFGKIQTRELDIYRILVNFFRDLNIPNSFPNLFGLSWTVFKSVRELALDSSQLIETQNNYQFLLRFSFLEYLQFRTRLHVSISKSQRLFNQKPFTDYHRCSQQVIDTSNDVRLQTIPGSITDSELWPLGFSSF